MPTLEPDPSAAGGNNLVFAKRQSTGGAETPHPLRRNRNFGNTTVRYAPLSARLGAKLRF